MVFKGPLEVQPGWVDAAGTAMYGRQGPRARCVLLDDRQLLVARLYGRMSGCVRDRSKASGKRGGPGEGGRDSQGLLYGRFLSWLHHTCPFRSDAACRHDPARDRPGSDLPDQLSLVPVLSETRRRRWLRGTISVPGIRPRGDRYVRHGRSGTARRSGTGGRCDHRPRPARAGRPGGSAATSMTRP